MVDCNKLLPRVANIIPIQQVQSIAAGITYSTHQVTVTPHELFYFVTLPTYSTKINWNINSYAPVTIPLAGFMGNGLTYTLDLGGQTSLQGFIFQENQIEWSTQVTTVGSEPLQMGNVLFMKMIGTANFVVNVFNCNPEMNTASKNL